MNPDSYTLASFLLLGLLAGCVFSPVWHVLRCPGSARMRLLVVAISLFVATGVAGGLLIVFILSSDSASHRLSAYLITKSLQISNRGLAGTVPPSQFVAVGMTERGVDGERMLFPPGDREKFTIIFEPHQVWSGRLVGTDHLERDPTTRITPTLLWVLLGDAWPGTRRQGP